MENGNGYITVCDSLYNKQFGCPDKSFLATVLSFQHLYTSVLTSVLSFFLNTPKRLLLTNPVFSKLNVDCIYSVVKEKIHCNCKEKFKDVPFYRIRNYAL